MPASRIPAALALIALAGCRSAAPGDAVTTVAGNGTPGFADGSGGATGVAELSGPYGIAVDSAGSIYVADTSNARIRKIDAAGNVTTLAGSGTAGWADGTGGSNGTAEFSAPTGVAVDTRGNVIVADSDNNRIRQIDTSGNVTTLAGNGTQGFADGTGGASGTAELSIPYGVAIDTNGNVYVADNYNARIRKIDTSGNVTTVAGNGTQGWMDGTGGATGTAEFWGPSGVAVDATGDVYVADYLNNRVRKIDTSGNVTTLAGNGTAGWMDGTGGANGTAEIWGPGGVAVDAAGSVYVATFGNRIQMIDPAGNVSTIAGNGTEGYADGTAGPSGTAEFHDPTGVAVDALANVFVADEGNNRIRRIEQ